MIQDDKDRVNGTSPYASGFRGDSRTDRDPLDPAAASQPGTAPPDPDTEESHLRSEQSHRLIGSDKVDGTAVFSRAGERIGTVHHFMVDKLTGQVEYAVMSFGGLLGLGQTYYPLPWQMLDYDTRLGGFRVAIDQQDLDRAPSFRAGAEPDFDDRYAGIVSQHFARG